MPATGTPPNPWKLTDAEGHTILIFLDKEARPEGEVELCDARGRPAEYVEDCAGFLASEELLMDLWRAAGGS